MSSSTNADSGAAAERFDDGRWMMANSKRRTWMGYFLGTILVGALALGGYVLAQTGDSNGAGGIAQPPRLLAYSGFLEQNGVTVDGTTPMRFFITDSASAAPTGCGGASGCLWVSSTVASMNVPVHDGHFAVVLGDTASGQTAFPASLFTRSTLFLRVLVGPIGASEQMLTGAQRLVATPYAITSETPTTFRVNTLQAAHIYGPIEGILVDEKTASSTTPVAILSDVPDANKTICGITYSSALLNTTNQGSTFAGCVITKVVGSVAGTSTWRINAHEDQWIANVTCSARCLSVP